jgi:hypothetical protein
MSARGGGREIKFAAKPPAPRYTSLQQRFIVPAEIPMEDGYA